MMAEQKKEPFNFNMAISIINLLGRDLYRDSITVLGEAISNSWDAEAEKVCITINEAQGYFSIEDDGFGMSREDFQEKFLNIGHSKRKKEKSLSPNKKRPYIGRKGIGKLALLSCAQKVHITSKTRDTDDFGVIIDNRELDEAINDDSNIDEYKFTEQNKNTIKKLTKGQRHGTLLYFETINDGVNINPDTMKKLLALHFRFDLILKKLKGDSFSISINGQEVKLEDLGKLSKETQFLWTIDGFDDPFFKTLNVEKQENLPVSNKNIKGFIASVKKPSNLEIFGSKEKTGVDIFVNGRLREANILRHVPAFATRYIASYIYGQIHLDILDAENSDDIFQTTRESIKLNDKTYQELLGVIAKEILAKVSNQWKEWRPKNKPKIPGYLGTAKKNNEARKKDFIKGIKASKNLEQGAKDNLVETLENLSLNNASVYRDLFILENIFRAFLEIRGIHNKEDLNRKFPSDPQIQGTPDIKGEKCPKCKKYTHKKGEQGCIAKIKEIKHYRKQDELTHDLKGKFVKNEHDFNYLDLVSLGILVDKVNGNPSGVHKPQAMEYYAKNLKPVRNAVMHTNEVSQEVIESEKIADIINIIDKLCSKSKP